MSVPKPYFRTIRQFADGGYRRQFVGHPLYAPDADSYVRGFLLLQKDLLALFEFIEPADQNEATYSFRTYELLLRACTEVETNCRAILKANLFTQPRRNLTMTDYRKIEKSHFLSSYSVRVPYWKGSNSIRSPFVSWGSATPGILAWYQRGYNVPKHDRVAELGAATFGHLVDAVCGIVVLLYSQYMDQDFAPGLPLLAFDGSNDGYKNTIGDFFSVKPPNSIPADERYDFDWEILRSSPSPFEKFDFDSV